MTDAISDRARMSTGGGSSERAAAATFAEYDREDDLRAAGADAPTDEGRLSERLQQKEVGVATSLQDAQVQLDNLRRNLGAVVEIDGVAGALACGGRGLASPSMRAVSSGMLDIKVDVCKTDELDGRVDGVRAREQQRSERGCMHGGKT